MDNNRRNTHKFTCYFCQKVIENETEMGHTAVCGNVLVPCPNKCGAYVARMEMKKHRRDCVNAISKSSPRLPTLNETLYDTYDTPPATSSLGRKVNGYDKHDNKIQEEIRKLSKKLTDMELRLEYNQHAQLPNIIQSYDSMKNNHRLQNLEMEKIKYQNKTIFEWKRNIDAQISNLKHSASYIQNAKTESDQIVMALQNRIIILEKMQGELEYLRDSFVKEQGYSRHVSTMFEQNFNDFKSVYSQKSVTLEAILNDHKTSIDHVKQEIDGVKSTLDEQKAKLTNVVFDLRAASQIASEAAEKLEIYERDFAETKKAINQIKLDLEILEGLTNKNDSNIKPGRILWKIDEFETKMLRAKEFNSVLKSPIFYSHEYGYKIRILMYLNGLKKWQDRYALVCIHVLKGEYDMLLKWPCHIEGHVTLRDLDDTKSKPFTKYITAKRQSGDEESEEPQESSNTYIFIPHNVLMKSNYIKEDTIFIDVKIQMNSKLETNL